MGWSSTTITLIRSVVRHPGLLLRPTHRASSQVTVVPPSLPPVLDAEPAAEALSVRPHAAEATAPFLIVLGQADPVVRNGQPDAVSLEAQPYLDSAGPGVEGKRW